jgi:antagonist of KipI
MADGPTVGGYPKIAVVISADLPIMAQRAVGAPLQFREVSIIEAQAAARAPWSELQRRSGDARVL